MHCITIDLFEADVSVPPSGVHVLVLHPHPEARPAGLRYFNVALVSHRASHGDQPVPVVTAGEGKPSLGELSTHPLRALNSCTVSYPSHAD